MSLYPVSERARDIYERAVRFVDTNVRPGQIEYAGELERAVDPWKVPAVIEDLKAKAREEGLWNLFLPDSEHGAGLTNLEYAPIAELTGHVPSQLKPSTAAHQTPATWSCCISTAPTSTKHGGSCPSCVVKSAQAS